jgi:hypothetical protein
MRVEDNMGIHEDSGEEEFEEEGDRNLSTEKSYLYDELLGQIDGMLEQLKLDA